MTISGNVGIGTTGPGSGFNTKLDVVGTTSLRTNSGDIAKAIKIDFTGTSHRIYTDATSGTPYDLILGTYPNGHSNQLVLQQSTGNVGIGTTSPGSKLAISGGATVGSTYAGTALGDGDVAISGNVGIGTTSPTAKLQVTGLSEYTDNAAALAAGLTAGAFYRTGEFLKVVF